MAECFLDKESNKYILCIGGGNESIIGIQECIRLGYKIVLADKSKKSPALKFCKIFIHESTKNPIKIIKKIPRNIKKNIKGVVCFGNDVAITVNTIAKKLKLNFYNINSAKILSNKLLTRIFLKKNKFSTIKFVKITSLKKLKLSINKFKKGVLKPIDNSGARGVQIIDIKNYDLNEIYKHSMRFSKKKVCIFEEYIDGDQISTESLIYKNKSYTIGISDRNYIDNKKFYPYLIENGSDMPSKYEKKLKKKIDNLMIKIARKLKIDNCILKGDLLIKNGKIFIIEIAGRLSGGYFSSIMIPSSVGVNLLKCAIKLATNKNLEKSDYAIKYIKPITQRYFLLNENGIIKKISLPKKLLKNKKLIFKELTIKKNSKISKITNHSDRLGNIIVTGKSKSDAIKFAENIIKKSVFTL